MRVSKLVSGSILLLPAVAVPESYDYIIVGGGTAGMVVANRLSEDANLSVLVVEAGPDAMDNEQVMAPSGLLIYSEWDFAYSTVPQIYTTGNKSSYIGAGRALGGTSAINGMTYSRTQAAMANAWETLGNADWAWDDVLPYYAKGTSLIEPTETQQTIGGVTWDADVYSPDGPVSLGWRKSSNNEGVLVPIFNETLSKLGLNHVTDVDAGQMVGWSLNPSEVNATGNVRQDSARAYYLPIKHLRPNLQVLTNTEASRLVWASSSNSTEGATVAGVVVNGTTIFQAKKEVIMSAGTVKTPVLLELSGVGQKALLESQGIDVIVDLPGVGENLQDQINLSLGFSTHTNVTDTAYPFVWAVINQTMDADQVSALSSSIAQNLSTYAAKQAAAINNVIDADVFERIFTLQHEMIFSTDEQTQVPAGQFGTGADSTTGGMSTRVWASFPFSRGSIHITGNSTSEVAINPRYLMHDSDIAMLTAMAKFVRKTYNTSPLSEFAVNETSPGLDVVADDNGAWYSYIRENAGGVSHIVGTASMLPRELGGVVDKTGKVYGTANLRVIDASIIPFQPSGPPSATVYAVAEKIAASIKQST